MLGAGELCHLVYFEIYEGEGRGLEGWDRHQSDTPGETESKDLEKLLRRILWWGGEWQIFDRESSVRAE